MPKTKCVDCGRICRSWTLFSAGDVHAAQIGELLDEFASQRVRPSLTRLGPLVWRPGRYCFVIVKGVFV